jgi:DnaK suppressor protein
MARTKTATAAKRRRSDELRKMLEDRRRDLAQDVKVRVRGARAEHFTDRQSIDEGEISELDTQDEIEFALIQMKAETLHKIDAALRRLDEGSYGDCFQCGEAIAAARLRALPFAVRCKDCEEAREMAVERDRHAAQNRNASALLFDQG